MPTEPINSMQDTRLDPDRFGTETLIDTSRDRGGIASPFGRDQLVENYHAIIKTGAIHYPVAYQFLRELGRGRQGRVFLALRQGARGCITSHAIKLYDPSIYTSEAQYWTDMGRIAAQISRLQAARSPSLLFRDVYEEVHGVGFVQMEVIDGLDLEYLLRGDHLLRARRRCTPQEYARFTDSIFRLYHDRIVIQPGVAVYVMRQILRGLEALHSLDFVHSDVKPGNVMIDRFGFVRLIDHGRATMDGEKMRILFGSPVYMAPEVHRRMPSTTVSDLYSVGLLGFEMLRGEPLVPLESDVSESRLMAMKQSLPSIMEGMLPSYVRDSRALVDILRRLLDPDPARRFASAEEVESGEKGLAVVHKQLVQMNKDTEYGRELEAYFAKLVSSRTGMVEKSDEI